jgi:hypothetical protein
VLAGIADRQRTVRLRKAAASAAPGADRWGGIPSRDARPAIGGSGAAWSVAAAVPGPIDPPATGAAARVGRPTGGGREEARSPRAEAIAPGGPGRLSLEGPGPANPARDRSAGLSTWGPARAPSPSAAPEQTLLDLEPDLSGTLIQDKWT